MRSTEFQNKSHNYFLPNVRQAVLWKSYLVYRKNQCDILILNVPKLDVNGYKILSKSYVKKLVNRSV
jgi:hypothetical protein